MVLEWPFKTLHLPGFKDKIEYAQLLHDASEIKFHSRTQSGSHTVETSKENDILLTLPVERPSTDVPVIELILK
jgi:alpha-L-fucosidase